MRPDLAAGRESFQRIMTAAGELSLGEPLEIIAPFEPMPLYAVMAEKGFGHQTTRLPDGGWKVTFKRR